MKLFYKIVTLIWCFSSSAIGQEQLKTLVATSGWKQINTLPLFETKSETPPAVVSKKNAENDNVPKPEKRAKKANTEKNPPPQIAKADIKTEENPTPLPAETSTDITPAKENTPSKKSSKKQKIRNSKELASTETKQPTQPVKNENVAPPKKKAPEQKPKVSNIVTENTLAFQAVEGVKTELQVPTAVETMYFTKQNRYTNKEKAYFVRKGSFDPITKQPKGLVEDYYSDTNKPKFKGQYERYNNDDETRNTKYDGRCEFYEEDGAKSIRIYSKGRLEAEFQFNKEGQQIAEAMYLFDRKRKNFKEFIFDNNGKQIGSLVGGYDSELGQEKALRQIFQNNKLRSSVEYIAGCPNHQGDFMTENDHKYKAVFQDFVCNPEYSKLWKFSNSSYFTTTHSRDNQQYTIRSTPGQQEQVGFLHTPITHDFYKKNFEIEATFELSNARPMSEVGIVWQYTDPKTYAYFKVNTKNKTFEINDITDNTPDNLMMGVKPQLPQQTSTSLKLTLKKVADNEFIYLVNDQALPFAKVKFPQFEKESKTWNIGFYFKAYAPNESLTLKYLEIKLL